MDQKKIRIQIGRRFRGLRATQGLSQKQLAVILGVVTHNNISRLERGAIRRLSIVFLNDCRTKCGMSIDWLLTGDGPMILPEAKFESTSSKSGRRKGKKSGVSQASVSGDISDLRRKLSQLATTLARATHLVQDSFIHITRQGSHAERR